MTPDPQPRLDKDGVPLCSRDCKHYFHPVSHSPWCAVVANGTDESRPCLPAVRQMAERERRVREGCEMVIGSHTCVWCRVTAREILTILDGESE